ncbi:malonic semialdehyde reductase [Methylopila capsulata]|uniref:Putative NADH dehydrogenase/NAD(P)H nitroreductase GCM10008170_08100 n=1 Tax=Methylopila capsulata TaxID=61654 RepID=A0A9W6MRA3_9HYPH|nr:malonic semialdehyde reductase [Methylopila capsulata]GLK54791.1 putative NADH dehydrogenase/NAD(P)H nitroreductase [Methylopila capsulata]
MLAQETAHVTGPHRAPIDDAALDALFRGARTHNSFKPEPVSETTLRALFELVKMGPTSANGLPGRFVFVTSPEAKAKLVPALSSTNRDKTAAAPVTVIVAYDLRWIDQLPRFFPHTNAKAWFEGNDAAIEGGAQLNGSLMGGYLILAARALGLDTGPMGGFDRKAVDEAFFAGTTWRSNFLVNLGYGDGQNMFDRLPRPEFDEFCKIV